MCAAMLASGLGLGALLAGCSPAPAPPSPGPTPTLSRSSSASSASSASSSGSSSTPSGRSTPSPASPSTSPSPSHAPLTASPATSRAERSTRLAAATTWIYQLTGYAGGRLDAIAAAKPAVAVVDLARDAGSDWFRADEIATVRGSHTVVLAYMEIGAIESYRPEAGAVDAAGGLVLNRWEDWPQEHFVAYWDPRWWDLVVRPRLDQALAAGFDGVYLDTPLAYEELDPSLVGNPSRAELAARMVALMGRIGDYSRSRDPGFLVVPQNSPELRQVPGWLEAVDGLGMEELFFLATDEPCTQSWCPENLAEARAVRAAGKAVLAVDYASEPANVERACRQLRQEGFAAYVGVVGLDRISPPCP